MSYSGFVDVAWHLYEQGDRKNETLLTRTGTDDRIDQGWVSQPLAPAIVDYQVLDTPEGASDHKGFAFRLDLSKALTDNVWDYR
jgi:hypothetical protein